MKRRDFIKLGGLAIIWPDLAMSDETERVRRIAMLLAESPAGPDMRARLAGFQEQFRALGWTEGVNIQVELRWFGGNAARAQHFAEELVGISPDVIVAQSTLGIEAVRDATRKIPTVFVMVGNPIGSGFVPNLAHPGGNTTGFSAFEPEIAGKWMQILKEIAPATRQVTVLSYPGYEFLWRGAEAAATALRVQVMQAYCQGGAEIERTLTALAGRRADGLVVLPAPLFASNRELIVPLAAKQNLPAVYPFRYYAVAGGLVSYGIDGVDIFRRASVYVDRILRGESPGDLPVQAPSKFELVINLKTAKALGLTISAPLLATASDMIE